VKPFPAKAGDIIIGIIGIDSNDLLFLALDNGVLHEYAHYFKVVRLGKSSFTQHLLIILRSELDYWYVNEGFRVEVWSTLE